MTITTPDWVKHAVFYQIFPDRFARSERIQHPPGIQFKPWGSPPSEQGYQGGDLYGVIDKLPYLEDLGVNALYLNPIFASASNHRYHTFDYYTVDPLLGGNEALRALLDEAHKRNMYVVLDGVFNHASRGFWQFHHILENGGDSPYIDWFTVHDWPLRPYSSDEKAPMNYNAWWDLPMLPQFNHQNEGVRQFIFDVARYWIDFGIDGWRLDVPAEVDDDSFWQEFRRVVKDANPQAYIVGEIWEEAQRWLQGDQFDAVMNYIFTWTSLSFFGGRSLVDYQREHYTLEPLNAVQFAEKIAWMHGLYDWEINHVQLNLLDSHDTARALWIMGEDQSALRLCALFQMTMPGAPCIYYGTEIGMSAGDDPDCREAFPWDTPETWDEDLLTFYRNIIQMRHYHPVLRVGDYRLLYAQGDVLVFRRRWQDQEAIVGFNVGDEQVTVTLEVEETYALRQIYPALLSEYVQAQDGKLEITIGGRDAKIGVTYLGGEDSPPPA